MLHAALLLYSDVRELREYRSTLQTSGGREEGEMRDEGSSLKAHILNIF